MANVIFKEGTKYTFSDYFNLSNPTEEIVAELGYAHTTQPIELPKNTDFEKTLVDMLTDTYYAIVPKVSLNSESAKREIMIAPVLHAVLKTLNAKLNIEYPIDINERLSGTIDYLFRSSEELIVIEAKKGDLERGYNQLAAEMIAIDLYEGDEKPAFIYGAISIGEVWRFSTLDRKNKMLTKDIHTFRFPEDINDLFAILTGILKGT